MPDGGTLTIETVNVRCDERDADGEGAWSRSRPARYAALIVSDTGAGMDRETLEHIFEPFFTTKGGGRRHRPRPRHGVRHREAERRLRLGHSEPGHGIVVPDLPAAGGRPSREPARGAASSALGGGSESILVAEDEPAVRAIVARSLREYGYTVSRPATAPRRWSWRKQRPAPPDLVIADVVMPGMGGKQLAEALETRWPGMPVLFISGYTGLDAMRRGLLDEGREFMQKPLEPDVVAEQGPPDPRRPT